MNIKIFENEKFGSIRTIIKNEDFYFSATDVAVALGYSNPRDAVRIHCKGVNAVNIPTNGGKQMVNFITEEDVYCLIMRSKNSSYSYKTELLNFLIPKNNKIYVNTRLEIEFKDLLYQIFEPCNIEVIFQYPIDKYRIDFYIPEYNLAIEYDECHHYNKTNQQKDKDRENYIQDKIGCTFIRVDYRDTNAFNIGLILKQIINKR